ncbi:hypothetical protein D3C87_1387050 [compost metagenome]
MQDVLTAVPQRLDAFAVAASGFAFDLGRRLRRARAMAEGAGAEQDRRVGDAVGAHGNGHAVVHDHTFALEGLERQGAGLRIEVVRQGADALHPGMDHRVDSDRYQLGLCVAHGLGGVDHDVGAEQFGVGRGAGGVRGDVDQHVAAVVRDVVGQQAQGSVQDGVLVHGGPVLADLVADLGHGIIGDEGGVQVGRGPAVVPHQLAGHLDASADLLRRGLLRRIVGRDVRLVLRQALVVRQVVGDALLGSEVVQEGIAHQHARCREGVQARGRFSRVSLPVGAELQVGKLGHSHVRLLSELGGQTRP